MWTKMAIYNLSYIQQQADGKQLNPHSCRVQKYCTSHPKLPALLQVTRQTERPWT
jgi:hypothetical protein